MDCKECRDEMTAYLDGELPAGTSEHVRCHLERCASCAREIGRLSEVAVLVETYHKRLELKPDSWTRVQARIAQPRFGWRSGIMDLIFARGWLPATAIALMAAAVAAGMWLHYRQVQADEALRLYMSDYVRVRDAQERQYRRAGNAAGQGTLLTAAEDRSDNPFLLARGSRDENPFRR